VITTKNKLIRSLIIVLLLSALPLCIMSVQIVFQYFQLVEDSLSFFDFIEKYYDSFHINKLLNIIFAFVIVTAPIFIYKICKKK
jgi:hypothetical protein